MSPFTPFTSVSTTMSTDSRPMTSVSSANAPSTRTFGFALKTGAHRVHATDHLVGTARILAEGACQPFRLFVPADKQDPLTQTHRHGRPLEKAVENRSPTEQRARHHHRRDGHENAGNRRRKFEDQRKSQKTKRPQTRGFQNLERHKAEPQQRLPFVNPKRCQREDEREPPNAM